MGHLYDFPIGVSVHDPNFRRIREMIAGFMGYETIEDLKAADNQVRENLAGQVKKTLDMADNARKILVDRMHLQVLPDFDSLISHMREAYERLLHPENERLAACTVYTPRKDAVVEMYSLDFRMLCSAENVFNLLQEFERIVQEDMILANIHKIDMSLGDILASMEKKAQVISCMIR